MNKLYTFNGNEAFLLDEPNTIWLIQSGSIALFAVPIQSGGTRRYLFSLESGKALFGIVAPSGSRQMLAVPIGETTLLKVSNPEITQEITSSIEVWLEQLKTVSDEELPAQAITEGQSLESILERISHLNQQFLDQIELLDRQSAEAELQRLHEHRHLDRQMTTEAFGELAATLNPQGDEWLLQGTPLLIAAGAVGKALGVSIHPPHRSENLQRVKEPLEAIARASKLRLRQVLLGNNWWKHDGGPLVAYTLTDNRPVALLPTSATSYDLFDPITQTRVPVNRCRAATLNSVAYVFYRSLPNKVFTAWELLRFALKGRARDLQVIFCMGLAVTGLGMITPQATAVIMDNAIPDSARALLLQIGLGLLVAAVGTALFQLTQGFAILRSETTGDAATQSALWDRLLTLPVSFFRQYTTGDLQSRVSAVSTIRQQIGGRTLINLFSGFFALFYLGQLFYYNTQLTLVALAVALVATVVTTTTGILLLRYVRPLLELQGNIFGQTVQLINGIAKLHVAGAQERAFTTWSKQYSRQVKLELSKQQIEDSVVLFNTLLPTITSGVLFWFTMHLIEKTQTNGGTALSLGTFLAFNAAFSNFLKGATDLSNTTTEVLQVIPQWKRTKPILEALPEVDRKQADPGQLRGNIIVERVRFRYRPDAPLVMDEVSLTAKPGEFIALVGSSGSGKSTLLRLLLGFETPEEGNIYYDSQDLSQLNVEAVRRQMGVVLQNDRLISASIFENIARGARITLDEAWEAVRLAGIADEIAAMPMQLHTIISEGSSNISVGQRQRLLIARALVLKPQILLLDEATSALDNRTQALVSENLERLQVTRIVIAHRLSTIRNAHRIYVFQAGRIVQQGSFENLASQEGLFAQLMARQMV